MSIPVECPCGRELSANVQSAGKKLKCSCGNILDIPARRRCPFCDALVEWSLPECPSCKAAPGSAPGSARVIKLSDKELQVRFEIDVDGPLQLLAAWTPGGLRDEIAVSCKGQEFLKIKVKGKGGEKGFAFGGRKFSFRWLVRSKFTTNRPVALAILENGKTLACWGEDGKAKVEIAAPNFVRSIAWARRAFVALIIAVSSGAAMMQTASDVARIAIFGASVLLILIALAIDFALSPRKAR